MVFRRIMLVVLLLPFLTACPTGDDPTPPSEETPFIEVSGSSIAITLQAGSAAHSQAVSIRNTGGGTLAWSAAANASWVSVSPASGSVGKGQSGSTTVTVNPAGMAPATYTASVTIASPGARNGSQMISVTLVVTPAPALSISTASLAFATQMGADAPAQTVSIANSGGGTLNWSASEDLPWLTVSPANGTLSSGQNAAAAVAVTTAGLTAGTYNGTINFAAPGASGSPKAVAVTLTIAPAPTIGLSAASFTFSAQVGANPPEQTLMVTNTGGGTLQWTASEPMAWLVGTPGTGSLSAGQSAAIALSVSTTGLQAGTYEGSITISAPGAANSPQSVPVSLIVTAAPVPALSVGPASVTFSAQQGSNPAGQTLTISNTGQGTLTWTASESLSWLVGSPGSGTLAAGQSATVTFTVSTAGLAPGSYTGTITVSAPGAANSPRNVPVTLTVTASPAVLAVTPSALVINGQVGSSPPAQTITISNSGGSALSWSAAESLSWLNLSSTSGNVAAGGSASVSASINTTGLTANTYTGTISVSATGATGSPKAISVSLTLTSTLLSAPVLSSPADGATGIAQSPTLSWNAVSGANRYWVTIATSQAALPTDPNASTCAGCVVSVNTSATSLPVSPALAAGTTYYWRVQGWNNSTNPYTQGQFSAVRSFRTTSPAPVFRIDGGTSSTRPIGETFNLTGSGFTPNGTATRYVREPSGNELNIGAVNVSASGTIGWAFTPVCTTALGTYTLWVVDNATSVSSNTVTETVTSSPSCTNLLPAPTLNSPSNGATGVSTTPTFSWSAVTGANRYWLMVATDPGVFPTDPNATSCSGCLVSGNTGSTSHTLPGTFISGRTATLASGTKYYWKVQAWNTDGRQGVYSSRSELTTAGGGEFRLTAFPIPNRNHQNAKITSVFDHSMATPYCPDNRIVAFTGEEGRSSYGRDFVWTSSCGALYGFRNATGSAFSLNGLYSGTYLYYDGHDGIDYQTTDQCPGTQVTADCPLGIRGRLRIRAAASGTVHSVNHASGTLEIRHDATYTTRYLHLDRIDVQQGQSVSAGQYIGVAGTKGQAVGPHLHFEVRRNGKQVDPYGWQGPGADPYTREQNRFLW